MLLSLQLQVTFKTYKHPFWFMLLNLVSKKEVIRLAFNKYVHGQMLTDIF